jgi:glycosyltransferase involved in cell wall biosynthesis
MASFANQLCHKFDITLCTVHPDQHFFELNQKVKTVTLNKQKISSSLFSFIQMAKKVKPDIIFSSLAHLNMMVLLCRPFLNKNVKIFIREGSVVSENILAEPHPKIMAFFYRTLYKKADKIICQSQFMINEFETMFKIPPQKCICLYNPIEFPDNVNLEKIKSQENYPNLLSIGRLDKVKQFEKVIEKIPHWLKKYPKLRYTIVGDGPEKENLLNVIKLNKLEKVVFLTGFKNDIKSYLKENDCFILSSKYEGLPNALLEAIAYQKGLLVLKHRGGAQEVLEYCNLTYTISETLELEENHLQSIPDSSHQKAKELLESEQVSKKLESLFNE